eukprot:CAMPEP_0177403536 /NCGR_PEP_ID=MMETSP0368-20130122/60901_1 /TAXON_ID=447022 ORGANISM="Scrippsiella hangoei-like, Strain SHHI-4" /NCGR_SAMPLE_ID=MMETSP0368 /ASSEMBLY_ACC=CAM_ASM_000363 /LENGTH=56 /DNA_ID=CAMNT_0018871521 /DNA_START=239 /DNA_END=405 /DNA_ORIENTATION=+
MSPSSFTFSARCGSTAGGEAAAPSAADFTAGIDAAAHSHAQSSSHGGRAYTTTSPL